MLPKEECEVLLNALLPAAENFLKKYQGFYPFRATMAVDDELSLSAAYDGNEFPDSNEALEDLIAAHRQMAEKKEIKVSGIAWDASVTTPDGKKSDAVIVSLEHHTGYSVIVGLPYQIGRFKRVKFGEMFADEGKHDIF